MTKPTTWIELSFDRVGTEIRISARGSRNEQPDPRSLGIDRDMLLRFASAVQQAARHGKPLGAATLDTARAIQKAVCDGPVGTLFAKLGEAASGSLLVRLMVHDAELQAVPWEALCGAGEALGFWGTSPNVLPVRGVASSEPWQPRDVHGAVKVLALAPTGSAGLANLKQALQERINSEEIDWLDPIDGRAAKVPGILDRLRREPIPHVIHFLGHGGIDDCGRPTLRMGDDDEEQKWLPVEVLAQQLASTFRGTLRLIVLEACEGAKPSVFASAAEILARAGAHAVVAHLWPVRADVARTCSAQFYRVMLGSERNGGDVAIALNEARRAMIGTYDASAEALSPVLYLRGPDGKIFNFGGRQVEQHRTSFASSAAPSSPVPVPARKPPMYGLGATSMGAGFIGRDHDLRELHRQLQGMRDVALTSVEPGRVAAFGGGGYGKTRLAAEYAYRHREEYPGGVFYSEALNRDPVSILAEMGRHISEDAPDKDLHVAAQFVTWLQTPGRSKVLLVFDDVQGAPDDVETRYNHRAAYAGMQVWPLDSAPNVKILFTTRLSTLPFAQPYRVATLADEAAQLLLVTQAGRQPQGAEDAQAAHTLATKTVAGHPLGLRLAGMYIRRTKISFRAYAELMSQRGVTATLEESAAAALAITDHDKSIRKTFDLSLEQLDDGNSIDALARTILLIAATLAPGVALDRELIGRVLEQWEGAPAREDEIGSSLARLVDDLALLEGQDNSLDVVIHPLVADFTRDSVDEVVFIAVQVTALSTLRKLFPLTPNYYWQILRPHTGRGWDWLSPAREAHAHAVFDATHSIVDDVRVSLGIALGDLHLVQNRLDRALLVYHETRNAVQSLLNEAPDQQTAAKRLAIVLDRIGQIHSSRGEITMARTMYEESLKVVEELSRRAPEDEGIMRDLAVGYSKIGSLFLNEDNIPEALKAFENGLAIFRRLLERHPEDRSARRDVSTSILNVANVQSGLNDDGVRMTMYLEALRIRRILAEEDRSDELAQGDLSMALRIVAANHADRGRAQEALTAFREACALDEELYLKDPDGDPQRRVRLAVSCSSIAFTLLGMGPADPARATEATELLKRTGDLLRPLAEADRLSADDKNFLADIEQHISARSHHCSLSRRPN